jgi:hypothetical protein
MARQRCGKTISDDLCPQPTDLAVMAKLDTDAELFWIL